MSNVVQRLLLFFLGIPAVLAVIVLLPGWNHGAAVAIVLVFTGGCGVELSRLFRSRGIGASSVLFAALGAGIPACAYAGGLIAGLASEGSVALGTCLGALLGSCLALVASFARYAFSSLEEVPRVLPEASALAFAALYPGLLGAFIVLIATEPRYATQSLVSFAFLCFMNDSLAWLAGVTVGRRRNLVAVSPNKSLAGFVAGMLGSIGTAFASSAFFPQAVQAPWWQLLLLGAVIGAASIVGDLFESALKRSAGAKDSGNAVPGRGGFMDSFDSLLFAAPLFYGLCLLFGLFR